MKTLNTAQKLRAALGIATSTPYHKPGKMTSNTKKGPGRIHLDGKKEEEEKNETNPS